MQKSLGLCGVHGSSVFSSGTAAMLPLTAVACPLKVVVLAAAAWPPLEPPMRATRNRRAIPLVIGRWVFMSPPLASPSTFFCQTSAQWMPVRGTHGPEPAEPQAVSPSGVGTGEDRESVALSARNRGLDTRRAWSDLEGDRWCSRYRRANGELASRARLREARRGKSRRGGGSRFRARDRAQTT